MMENLADFLKHLPTKPGVYQMYDKHDKIIYIGKAKDLKKRVSSYFRKHIDSEKTVEQMTHVVRIDITITQSETEALLLECNLIKKHKPKYNVIFRDSKGYPYLQLTTQHDFPSLAYFRGNPNKQVAKFFGPYPSSHAVHDTLNLIQKLFRLRQCSETFFRNRSRPCLQHQIKRCSAPCVGFIDQASYQKDVTHAEMVLSGKDKQVLKQLVHDMEHAAKQEAFEDAARLRDQIISLRKIQAKQFVEQGNKNVDVLAVAKHAQTAVISVLYIRDGKLLGNKIFFPKTPAKSSAPSVLEAFITQYYLEAIHLNDLPKRIIVNHSLENKLWLEATLTSLGKRKITISHQVRSHFAQWQKMAVENADTTLKRQLSSKRSYYHQLQDLQKALGLDNLPKLMECFDVSHTMGEATIASCVVFDDAGPVKQAYRAFNIEGIQAGDDYAALKQALRRRYEKRKSQGATLPDILIIDGGKGQIKQAELMLDELQLTGITLLSIAKGPTRKPGLETILLDSAGKTLTLPPTSHALHLLQHIRDEAHRFAITSHRKKRGKARVRSPLENIPGVGPKRRQTLLNYFGGLQALKAASIDDIASVEGISPSLAKLIHTALK